MSTICPDCVMTSAVVTMFRTHADLGKPSALTLTYVNLLAIRKLTLYSRMLIGGLFLHFLFHFNLMLSVKIHVGRVAGMIIVEFK